MSLRLRNAIVSVFAVTLAAAGTVTIASAAPGLESTSAPTEVAVPTTIAVTSFADVVTPLAETPVQVARPVFTAEQMAFFNAVAVQEARPFLLAKALTPPGERPYKEFANCHQAVDYIFAGRSDLKWAHAIVQRESNGVPTAFNGQHKGCAEESNAMRAQFMPANGWWQDAYFNVLVFRRGVDEWGKCHWNPNGYCGGGKHTKSSHKKRV